MKKGFGLLCQRQKDALGEYRDIFHPITKEARDKLIEAVLSAYRAGEKRLAAESNPISEVSQQNSAL